MLRLDYGKEVSGLALPDAVLKFLQEPNLAVLATVGPGGRPQATPVWFLFDNDHILINTSKGRLKLRNMQANPRVAVTVLDPKDPYRYVQIQGKVVKFDPEGGARDIERLSQRYRGQPYRYAPTNKPEDRISVIIKPVRVSALGTRRPL